MLDFIQNIDELIGIVTLISGENQEEVAKAMGYSRPHFSGLLKKSRKQPDAELLNKAKLTFEKEILHFVRKYGSLGSLDIGTAKPPTLDQVATNLELLAKSLREINSPGSGSVSLPALDSKTSKTKDPAKVLSGKKPVRQVGEFVDKRKDSD